VQPESGARVLALRLVRRTLARLLVARDHPSRPYSRHEDCFYVVYGTTAKSHYSRHANMRFFELQLAFPFLFLLKILNDFRVTVGNLYSA